jgi:Fe-S-cluster containining protein
MAGTRLEIEAKADQRILETLSQHCCVACGECCRWHGYVLLHAGDIKWIASKLDLAESDFLLHWCIVVWWRWGDCDQFRIALARKPRVDECIFLDGARCRIHEYKPLQCKAGPAAWSWISNPKFFWFYVRNSPSFDHRPGTFSLTVANSWFVATRNAAAVVSQATSLQSLAVVSEVSEETLRRLDMYEFREEDF